MAQQTIDIGTTPNDGTGDPLRDAFDKCNDNFTELYGGLGAFPFTGSAQITGSDGQTGAVLGITGSVEVLGDLFSQNVQTQQLSSATGIDTRIELADNSIKFFTKNINMLETNYNSGTSQGTFTFNINNEDVDFVVHGDNTNNLLFVNAGTNRVGIATSSPQSDLDVNGKLQTDQVECSLPTTDPGVSGELYMEDSATLGGNSGYKVVVVSQG